MRRSFRDRALAMAPVCSAMLGLGVLGVAAPSTCAPPPICQALYGGICYYADDLPGQGGRGTFADPFRLGDLPSSSTDCDDRGALPARFWPGDVFYFRGGTYELDLCANENDGAWYKPAIDAQGDGTLDRPIVFRSYPGEQATLRRRSGRAPLAGSYQDDHVRFIGLGLEYPRVAADASLGRAGRHTAVILGAQHVAFAYDRITLFDHPVSSGTTDNHDAIYIDNSDFVYIGHNRFVGPGNPANPVPAGGCTSVKEYRTRFSVIEDNWFDAAVNAIVDKEAGVDNTYRRNLTTRTASSSFGANGNDIPWWSRNRIYDNVFDNGIRPVFLSQAYEVFRNDVKSSVLFDGHGSSAAKGIRQLALFDNILRRDGNADAFLGNQAGQTWAERGVVFRRLDDNCYVGSNAVPRYLFGGSGGFDIRRLVDMQAVGLETKSRAVATQGACGAGSTGLPVGPLWPNLVTALGRYGPGNESTAACSDGIDQDGDWLVDYPADPDCRKGPSSASEGQGTTNVAPWIVSVGGPYVSHGGAPVRFDVTTSDPDSKVRVSWKIEETGACSRRNQYFAPTQLVEDPELRLVPAVDGTCTVRFSAYDDLGRVATQAIPIQLYAR